ncbi:hypothetical protein D3C87_279800 [compost metagenome]
MTSQTMNLRGKNRGEFVGSSSEAKFVKEMFHSAGVLLGGFLVSVVLASLEGRKLSSK